MSSFTPNIDLLLTPADDTTTTFKEWRTGINGDNNNSNMAKIDKAIGDLNQNCSELNAKVDAVFDKNSVQTWKDVQSIVRSGLASQYFNIGDQFVVEKLTNITATIGASTGITAVTVDANKFVEGVGETRGGEYVFKFDNHSWRNADGSTVKLADYGITITGTPKANDTITVTETTEQLTFDVIGIDHDTPADANYTHSMTLQLHDLLSTAMVFDAEEAIIYVSADTFPNGMAPGVYTIDEDGYYYCFTLTKAVPVGGQIVYSSSGSDVVTYASVGTTTILETAAYTNPSTTSGTVITASSNSYSDSVNDINRARNGSGDWDTSEIRQWLNSDGDANTWWVAQTVFDRPGSTAAKDGFLKNLDPAFLDVVGTVTKNTQKSITEGYGISSSSERFFLLSRSEVYGGNERTADGSEGEAYPYYGSGYSTLSAPGTGSDKNRVKYRNGSAYYWWLRTPTADNGRYVRLVIHYGNLNFYNANGSRSSFGVAPACVIV